MDGFVIATLIVASYLVGVWALARNGTLWCRVQPGTIVIVVAGESDPDNAEQSVGGVVDILHEVPGKITDKSSSNKFDWRLIDGTENRGLLHFLLGVQWIGFARSLRINNIKGCDSTNKFIYWSREQDVEVEGAKTMGVYRLNFRFNVLRRIVFPVRAALGVSNPDTVLGLMVEEVVANISGTRVPEYFLQGDASHKKEIVDAVKELDAELLDKIGTSLSGVNLLPITLDEESRKLFELAETTRRENEAAIQIAEKDKKLAILKAQGEKEAGILANDVKEDHVNRVLIPTCAAVGGPAVRIAEAIEKTNLGTLALGVPVLPMISSDK